MVELTELFERNRRWSDRIKEGDPEFFTRLSLQQKPEILWIGCADSRVPANQIIDLPPGEVFVHRNIANVVVSSDLNCLSVIQFAVEVLKVKHIIVCGHYACGGVQAALSGQDHGLIDNWLRHIQNVHRMHLDAFHDLPDEKAKVNLLCELNVIEQVYNVCRTTIVRNAWQNGSDLSVHGWVYDIADGILKGLCARNRETKDLDEQTASPRIEYTPKHVGIVD
ncbi:MAG: carbonate dehydratase [Pseudomonadota bacterium]